jgi:hypothetical protein
MVKTLALILTLAGMISLVLGVFGIFGTYLVTLNPWALAILGLIFFSAGIGLLRK